MSIWFSSDWHFNHKNITGPKVSSWDKGYRDFDSIQEMNDTIINNLNSKIAANDQLFFLGDFAFGDKKQIPALRDRINCNNIFLIAGNHDEVLMKEYQSYFNWCRYYYELRVAKQLIVNFHYPLITWKHGQSESDSEDFSPIYEDCEIHRGFHVWLSLKSAKEHLANRLDMWPEDEYRIVKLTAKVSDLIGVGYFDSKPQNDNAVFTKVFLTKREYDKALGIKRKR